MAQPLMSKEWNEFMKTEKLPAQPATIQEARQAKKERGLKTQALLSDPKLKLLFDNVIVTNSEIELPEVPGHRFPIRVYKPANPEAAGEKLPIMLYFHGGYWCTGDSISEDLGCRAIVARGENIVIVSFEYRLAPETQWHEVFMDAERALQWMATTAHTFGGDISLGFLIGGAEAGAHLASITAIRARDRYPHIKLTGQVLIVPTSLVWPDDKLPESWRLRLTSHMENHDAPALSEKLYEMYVSALGVPDTEKRKGENFPVWDSLQDLPPAYLPMDECDPIRDQGFLLAELMAEAGVKTRTDYYRGLPNMFVQFPELPTTITAGINLSAGVQWLLQHRK